MLASPDPASVAEQEIVNVVEVSPERGETEKEVITGGVVSVTPGAPAPWVMETVEAVDEDDVAVVPEMRSFAS